jgi:2-amino-4-hydroxy-6-hydroxymethyldihydropteridine diphosphokinase
MQQAFFWLKSHFGEASVRGSRLYRTPAIGGPENQQEFLNAVVAVQTSLTPWEVWNIIREIEQRMGRERNIRWEARAIDIDVLLYEGERIWTPHFKVPHPRMTMRRFVLEPALEVAADWIEPVTGWSIQQLFDNLANTPPHILLCGSDTAQLQHMAFNALSEIEITATQCQLLGNSDATSKLEAQKPWIAINDLTNKILSPADLIRDGLSISTPLQPNLLIVIASPPPNVDVAWEDWLRCWADILAMRPNSTPHISWNGPRYLLPLQSVSWATHELVAAFQAMQCPVVPKD